MSNSAKREYLETLRARYRLARKPSKKLILDEFDRARQVMDSAGLKQN